MLSFLSSRATAAHLALVAVSPLVLCKYFACGPVGLVMLWISLIAVVWSFMSPSKGEDEHTPVARTRMIRGVIGDRFVWMAIVLAGYCAVVAVNDGVALAYDAERSLWSLRPAAAPLLPGSVTGASGNFFAAAVVALAVYSGVVHSLDSRQAVYFALFAAAVAVLDAVLAVASGVGIPGRCAAAYGLWALAAVAAMFSAERSERRPKEMLAAIVLAGCVAAMLLTRKAVVVCSFGAAMAVFLPVFAIFSFRKLRLSGTLRAFALLFVSLAIAAALYHWWVGDWAILIPKWRHDSDATVSGLAYGCWSAHPWLGVGLGAFPMAAKLSATSADWAAMGPLPDFYANGWRAMLVERGMVGVLAVTVSIGALLFSWFRRTRMRGRAFFAAAVPLLPLAVAAVSVSLVFDDSALCAESLIAFAAVAAFSVNGGS